MSEQSEPMRGAAANTDSCEAPFPLLTKRLLLRPIAKQDGRLLQALFRDSEVTRYLPWGHPYSETETAERLQQLLSHWRRYGFGTYVIRPHAGRPAMGYAGLETVDGTPQVELLYALARTFWGRGYATEAAAACLRFGFAGLDLERIVGVIAPKNDGSRRLLEKLGMKPAPEMDFYGKGLHYYALSRVEYEKSEKLRERS